MTACQDDGLPRGRPQSLLTDYSKYKANLTHPAESRPRLPSPNHRSCSRSRSRSRSRSLSRSCGRSNFPLNDEYAMERLKKLEQEIQRIEIDINNSSTSNSNGSTTSLGLDESDQVKADVDIRMTQSERITMHYSDASLGLIDLQDDEDEKEDAQLPRKYLDLSDPSIGPRTQQSLPLLGLHSSNDHDASLYLKKGKNRSASSLTSFVETYKCTGRSSLEASRATTEELRSDINRVLITTRRRSRSNTSTGATPPSNGNGKARRSNSLGAGGAPAEPEEAQQLLQQQQDPSSQLRRFRRNRRNSCTMGNCSTNDLESSAWHNSTGQLHTEDGLTTSGSTRPRRSSIRRSKSTAESTSPPPLKSNKKIPPRAKTISYTTTRGKNSNEQSFGKTSNHGFLTGSRIKRTIPNL